MVVPGVGIRKPFEINGLCFCGGFRMDAQFQKSERPTGLFREPICQIMCCYAKGLILVHLRRHASRPCFSPSGFIC